MSLPIVTNNILQSMLASIENGANLKPYLDALMEEQPVLAQYLASVSLSKNTYSKEEAVLVGVVTYLMLKNASDAKDLETLFKPDGLPKVSIETLQNFNKIIAEKGLRYIGELFEKEQSVLTAYYNAKEKAGYAYTITDILFLYTVLRNEYVNHENTGNN